jgi:hypothetical protein
MCSESDVFLTLWKCQAFDCGAPMSVLFFVYLIEVFCNVYLGGLDLHCNCTLPVVPVATCRSSHSKFIIQSETICIIPSLTSQRVCPDI